MYFVEWLAWLVAIEPKKAREEVEKNNKTPKNRKLYESEDNEDVEVAKKKPATHQKAVAQFMPSMNTYWKCAAACGKANGA